MDKPDKNTVCPLCQTNQRYWVKLDGKVWICVPCRAHNDENYRKMLEDKGVLYLADRIVE